MSLPALILSLPVHITKPSNNVVHMAEGQDRNSWGADALEKWCRVDWVPELKYKKGTAGQHLHVMAKLWGDTRIGVNDLYGMGQVSFLFCRRRGDKNARFVQNKNSRKTPKGAFSFQSRMTAAG